MPPRGEGNWRLDVRARVRSYARRSQTNGRDRYGHRDNHLDLGDQRMCRVIELSGRMKGRNNNGAPSRLHCPRREADDCNPHVVGSVSEQWRAKGVEQTRNHGRAATPTCPWQFLSRLGSSITSSTVQTSITWLQKWSHLWIISRALSSVIPSPLLLKPLVADGTSY